MSCSYWVNQNVIDGVVNGVGRTATLAARYTYLIVDQWIVDGAVNEDEASAAGGERPGVSAPAACQGATAISVFGGSSAEPRPVLTTI